MKFELSHFLFFLFGIPLGFLVFWVLFRLKKASFEDLANHLLDTAQMEAAKKKHAFELELKEREFAHTRRLEALNQEAKSSHAKEEEKLFLREEKLEAKLQLVVKKISEIEKKEESLNLKRQEIDIVKKEADLLLEKREKELENLSCLTKAQAKEKLLAETEKELLQDVAKMTSSHIKEAQENVEKEVSRILATALNRLEIPSISEITVTTVAIPHDEMKARIIGREGRNIRHLEQLTGVNFVLDETPGCVCLSSFDPIRKQIAKIALTDLIQDGRIHPTSIEEAYEKAKKTVEVQTKQKGQEAALRAGVFHLHPELIALLGKLSFRTSFGQNVLEHSIEVAYLMGLIAEELKLDADLAKRIGLLHDMGKAISHEKGGSHAIVGHDLALKYGERESVANGIGCHHHEMPPTTIEGSLCSTADAISGGRLGARSEAIEQYLKRMGKLETISSQFPGVEKAYALSAGREVRVIVVPEMIDDKETLVLARELAKRIEEELIYQGKIKVTVIREKKAIEYAT